MYTLRTVNVQHNSKHTFCANYVQLVGKNMYSIINILINILTNIYNDSLYFILHRFFLIEKLNVKL